MFGPGRLRSTRSYATACANDDPGDAADTAADCASGIHGAAHADRRTGGTYPGPGGPHCCADARATRARRLCGANRAADTERARR
jgi:hypothetical protein